MDDSCSRTGQGGRAITRSLFWAAAIPTPPRPMPPSPIAVQRNRSHPECPSVQTVGRRRRRADGFEYRRLSTHVILSTPIASSSALAIDRRRRPWKVMQRRFAWRPLGPLHSTSQRRPLHGRIASTNPGERGRFKAAWRAGLAEGKSPRRD